MKIAVVILGAGGHGAELASYIGDLGRSGQKVELAGFIDEKKPKGLLGKSRVLGGFAELSALLKKNPSRELRYITAVGDDRTRQKLVERAEALRAKNLIPWTLRHPSVWVGDSVTIGEGTCLAPGSLITTRSRIGRHCILNVGVSVSHDCRVGDFVNLNPGAVICGSVKIGTGCYIGAGATVIDGIKISSWTVVGAGAVVVEDLPAHVTAVGVPARVIKRHPA